MTDDWNELFSSAIMLRIHNRCKAEIETQRKKIKSFCQNRDECTDPADSACWAAVIRDETMRLHGLQDMYDLMSVTHDTMEAEARGAGKNDKHIED